MGLLDALTNMSPAMQQGLLATGLGMLANNRGGVSTAQALGQGGLLGMNAYSSANENALKNEMARQQMAQVDADTQMKQQQLAMSQRQFNIQQSILQGTGLLGPQAAGAGTDPTAGAPAMLSAPAGAGGSALAGAMGAAGQDTNAAPLPAAAAATPAMGGMGGMGGGTPGGMGGIMSLSPQQRADMSVKLHAAGMKDLADAIAPSLKYSGAGIEYDEKTGTPTGRSMPIVDQTGHGIQMVANGRDAQGNPTFAAHIPEGMLSAMTGYKTAEKAIEAGFTGSTTTAPDGTKYFTTQADNLATTPMGRQMLQNAGMLPGSGQPGMQPGSMGGPQGNMQPGQGQPGMQGAGGMGSGQQRGPAVMEASPSQLERLKLNATHDATDLDTLDKAADAAPDQIAQYQQLKGAIQTWNKQKDSASLQALQEKIKSVWPGYQGGTSMQMGQVIDNLGAQMTADMRTNLGMTRMTDSDLKYLNNLVAGKGTNPDAANQIIDARVAMLSRKQTVRQMASQWDAHFGGLSARNAQGQRFQDALQDWSNKYTLQDQIKAMQQQPQQGQ